MYQHYYDLKQDPFRLTPDSLNCFKHSSYNHAKTYMQFALYREEGVVVVTGQSGIGKSAMIGDLSFSISPTRTLLAQLVCTQLQDEDLLRMIAFEFDLKQLPDGEQNIIDQLTENLTGVRKFGRRPLLIVDEAQNLPLSALQTIQKLAQLRWNDQHLLQIFLVGQEVLYEKLLDQRLAYLHEQIKAVIRLEALDEPSTKLYVEHRLKQAGWSNRPTLSDGIFPHIFHHSRGVPRSINLICSRMLLHGMTEELTHIEANDILQAIQSLMADHLLPGSLQSNTDMLV